MPLPIGANARNLQTICRWSLLAMVLLAPLSLWWPTLEGWSIALLATTALWLVWLCWRSAAGRTDLPGNYIHVALLSVFALSAYHVATGDIRHGEFSPAVLGGLIDVSMVIHMVWLALLVMMIQDLLAYGNWPDWALSVLGAFVYGGGVLGCLLTTQPHGPGMLAMMGWTGIAIFLSPHERLLKRGETAAPELWHRLSGRNWRVLAAVAMALPLAALWPPSLPLMAAGVGVGLLAAALATGRRGGKMALVGAGCLAVTLAAGHSLGWLKLPPWPVGLAGWLGRGESALGDVSGWDNALVYLAGTVGWAGMLGAGAGLLIALAVAARGAGHANPRRQPKAVSWLLVAALSAVMIGSPGGLFSPGANVVFAGSWGLLPGMMGRPRTRRTGWWLIAVMVVLTLMVGLVHSAGMLGWTSAWLGGSDGSLHLAMGWLITQVLLWRIGRRWRGFLVAVGITLAVAGAGEIAQWLFTDRRGQFSDSMYHAIGAGCAVVLYAMCKASLLCESSDMHVAAPPTDPLAEAEHRP